MSKLAEHLRRHLTGEVLDTRDVRDYFSTDGGIFRVPPRIVAYPHNPTDVRKIVRFSWQLAEQGKKLPITARGKGTDQGGAAVGSGLMLVLPAHMNRLLGFDKTDVSVQPGMLFGDLQRTLHSHNRFLPPYPSSVEYSTIGGAVANDTAGEKSLRYGSMRNYVRSLEVVLANGQLVSAQKLNKRELNRKKGQADFEGEIYRQLDGLLEDNAQLIENARPQVSKNSAGYALWDVRGKDGSFDLSKLIIGSQGTLGVVTEITLATEPYSPQTHLLAAFFDSIHKAGEAVTALQKLNPSAMEVVDVKLLEFLQRTKPQQLEGIIEGKLPEVVVLVEFDDIKLKNQKRQAKRAKKILSGYAKQVRLSTEPTEQERLWQIRRSAAAVIWQDQGTKKALPIIEAAIVPKEKFSDFLDQTHKLLAKYHLDAAIWGHAGDANLHMQPFLDLGNVGDRQAVFKLMDEFYEMVIAMGGSTAGEHGDGRIRAPYLKDMFGPEMYELFAQVKKIFDPHNILNPGVKIGVSREDIMPLVRNEYSMKHLYDHMPHTP